MGTMRCYRRNESPRPNAFGGDQENPDSFEKNHGLIGQPTGCSYCGSMDPAVLMEFLRQKIVRLEATDKSYKLYVHGIPSEKEGELRIVGHSSSPGDQYRPWSELNKAEKKLAKKEYDNEWHRKNYGKGHHKTGGYMFSTWGSTVQGKFYMGHLSEEQGDEFIRLDLAGEIPWGYRPYRALWVPHSEEMERELSQMRAAKKDE